ncbi:hypothetical protein [Burkholderia diffusa]|uniref:hypothetical protein n=1 Tax=Burkholderia diffusa TaxID=488732 RepID=UPI001E50FF2B|nr:hypothetical protein [Burkholderia diffusa]
MLGDTTAGLGLSTFQGRPAISYVADKVENAGIGARYDWGNVRLHVYTDVKLKADAQSHSYRTLNTGFAWQGTPANAVSSGMSTTSFIGRRYGSAALGRHLRTVETHPGLSACGRTTGNGGRSSTRRQLTIVAGVHHLF